MLRLLQRLGKCPATGRDFGERLRAGAEIAVGIGQVGLLADQADREIAHAPALADARVEHRCFAARIRADDQQRVGLLDARDGGVEQVGRPAPLRVERGAVLPAIEIDDAEPSHQVLQREDLLDRREIADDRADALRRRRLDLGGDGREGLRPGRRPQPAMSRGCRAGRAAGCAARRPRGGSCRRSTPRSRRR